MLEYHTNKVVKEKTMRKAVFGLINGQFELEPLIECTLEEGIVTLKNIATEELREKADQQIRRFEGQGITARNDIYTPNDGEKFFEGLFHYADNRRFYVNVLEDGP